MRREIAIESFVNAGYFAASGAFRKSQYLLATLACTSAVGFAILDKRMRYIAINRSLASMNGIPPEAHLGKTLFQILGDTAAKVEPTLQRVIASGKNVLNAELAGELPTRTRPGHWIVNYFPIQAPKGRIGQVSVTVSEVSSRDHSAGSLPTISHSSGPQATAGKLSCLTPREGEVLKLLADGNTNRQIASILNISVRTVETYRARIMYKVDSHSISGLVRYAVRNNIIPA